MVWGPWSEVLGAAYGHAPRGAEPCLVWYYACSSSSPPRPLAATRGAGDSQSSLGLRWSERPTLWSYRTGSPAELRLPDRMAGSSCSRWSPSPRVTTAQPGVLRDGPAGDHVRARKSGSVLRYRFIRFCPNFRRFPERAPSPALNFLRSLSVESELDVSKTRSGTERKEEADGETCPV